MLTNLQQETLDAIQAYIDDNGYSPSSTDLADRFNVGQNAIMSRLKSMRKKGVIDWKDGQRRTLHIIKAVTNDNI